MDYAGRRQLNIPLDRRLGVGLLWLASVGLLALDSVDDRLGIASAWALLIGLAAAVLTLALLHLHNRRVLLEVMSWEHQHQVEHATGESPVRMAERVLRAQPPQRD